jgi:hypothetical protein
MKASKISLGLRRCAVFGILVFLLSFENGNTAESTNATDYSVA